MTWRWLAMGALVAGCGGGDSVVSADATPLPMAACSPAAGGGSAVVAQPELIAELSDRWHEAWLGSPAVADLDGDAVPEILAARGDLVLGWHTDNEIVFRAQVAGGRIWASPVVADLLPARAGLEVAVAARDAIYAWGADGQLLPGFPYTWRDELRSLAAGDIDDDGELELVAVTTTALEAGGQRDTVIAVNPDGTAVAGFPPNTSGASGCDNACYVTGGYDQNIALGDVDGDGVADLFVTQDNAYLSLYAGDGRAFDGAVIFPGTKFSGVRFLLDYSLAQQGWAPDEESANQAHFTNSAPAIADIDQDGTAELVVLGSVQNAAQTDRLRGVALWVLESDATRTESWVQPLHVMNYLAGLWDFEGTNVVGATNQVAVADINPARSGFEMVFAGFDGRIHAVDSRANELWSHVYTTSDRVLTSGVAVADLSGDGVPEIVFATYSPDEGESNLVVLNAGGSPQHTIALPGRGAMPVPTIADADADGDLDIVVNLKDGEDRVRQVQVYSIAGSSDNCMLWTTGRGNLLRDGWVR